MRFADREHARSFLQHVIERRFCARECFAAGATFTKRGG
jgi:hypothetical protein